MKKENLKVGDFAVNVGEDKHYLTIGKKYPIVAITARNKFVFLDDDDDAYTSPINDKAWSFEPNPTRLNTQKVIAGVATKVLVTFEKTEIEHGEEYLIKTIELADMPDLRKEVEYQIRNLANPQADVVNVKWEK